MARPRELGLDAGRWSAVYLGDHTILKPAPRLLMPGETLHPTGTDGVYFNVQGVAVVRWDATSRAAHIEWQGWATPIEFRGANDALIRILDDHRSSRVLGDSRLIKAIQQSDQDWVNGDWFPRILAAGLRRIAMVAPLSGLARMNIDEMVSRVPGAQLDVAYFATLEEARAWLTRPDSSPFNELSTNVAS